MLIEQLTDQGFQVFIRNGLVGIKPATKLTPKHRQLIKSHKEQILEELTQIQNNYKTTLLQVSPKEAVYQHHQRPDESHDDYLGRVIDESLSALLH